MRIAPAPDEQEDDLAENKAAPEQVRAHTSLHTHLCCGLMGGVSQDLSGTAPVRIAPTPTLMDELRDVNPANLKAFVAAKCGVGARPQLCAHCCCRSGSAR